MTASTIIGVGGSIAAGLAFSGQPSSHYEMITRWIYYNINWSHNEFFTLWIDYIVNWSHNEFFTLWIDYIVNWSHYELISLWTYYKLNQSQDESITRWINHKMNQSQDESITRWINHIMNWSHYESITWLVVGNYRFRYRYANIYRYLLTWNQNFSSFELAELRFRSQYESIALKINHIMHW
jgi:hypothetical protein